MNNGTSLRSILERVAANAISDEQALSLLRDQARRPAVVETSSPSGPDIRRQFAAEMVVMAAELLEVESSRIDPRRRIADYGMNSVMAADFIRRVEARYGVRLAATIFLEFLDLRSLIDHMFEIHHDAIRQAFLDPAPAPAPVAPPAPQSVAAPAPPATDDVCASLEQLWQDSGGIADPVPSPAPAEPARALQQPVAIIGIAGRLPGSPDLETFWRHLEAGHILTTGAPASRLADGTFRPAAQGHSAGAFLDDVAGFDAAFFQISDAEAATMDPQQRLLLEQVWLAVENAGYQPAALAGTRTGVFASAATTDYLDLALEANAATSPYMATGLAHSVLANRISYQFDWRGPSELVNTACSSSAVALHRAAESIRRGDCDLAVACAVNLILHSRVSDSFASGGLLSPQGLCRPFRAAADGFVRGEGCGAVVLKLLARAIADRDPIHAVLVASATNHQGRASALTAPSPDAQADVMLTAWEASGLDPQSLDFIEANGIGSPLGDQSELLALRKAFARKGAGPQCTVGSVKANVGSLETASGMAALFKVIGALRCGVWPGDPHAALPVVEGAGLPVADAATPIGQRRHPLRIGLNSFGLAGVNAHLVLEEYRPPAGVVSRPSLPPTVFTRRRHWFEAVPSRATAAPAAQVDLTLTPEVHLRLPLHPTVPHVVHGQAVAPLGLLLDCALRAAAACGLPLTGLHHLSIVAPMLPANEALVHVERDGRFSISPALDGVFGPASEPSTISLQTIHAHTQPVDLDLLRQRLRHAGIEDPLASFTSLRTAATAALARWEAPAAWLREWDQCRVPPAVVSDAVMTIAAFLAPASPLLAPVAIGAVTVHSPVPQRGYIYVQQADALYTITIASLTGAACLELSGVALRAVPHVPPLDPLETLEQWSLQQVLHHLPELAGSAAEAGAQLRVAPARRQFFAALHRRVQFAAPPHTTNPEPPAEWQAHATLLRHACGQLRAYLRDEISGLEILFPEGSAALVEAVYGAASPVADTVAAFVRGAAGNVRVLECGAGTGAASTAAWRAIEADAHRVAYDFTDVSPGLVRLAQDRFANALPNLRFAVLDAEQDPTGQGFAAGAYDVVFAANVIHATADPSTTLRHLARLLRPGGLLALQECEQDQTFLLLTFGLLDGWWRFADPFRQSRQSPLLTGEQWADLLRAAGLDSVTIASRQAGQVLLTATQPAAKTNPGELRQHIAQSVTTALCEALRVSPLDLDLRRPFVELGLDSVIGVAVTARIGKSLGISLRPTALFSYPSLDTLVDHLANRHGEQIQAPTPVAAEPTTVPATTDIAIIGVAGRFPGAPDLDSFWRLLADGRHGIRRVPPERWDAAAYYAAEPRTPGKTYSVEGGFLDGIDQFDAPFFSVTGREAEWTDPQHRIFLEEAWRALEDAGYAREGAAARRCGVFVGAGGGDYLTAMLQDGCQPGAQAFWGNTASVMAGRISYLLNVNGPSLAVDTACSSSLTAIHLACQSLLQGECDLALAGGVFVAVTPTFHVLASDGNMLSPDGRCRTFDQGANGFVPGEGAGAVVLKPLQAALRDGDAVHAVIKATAINQDGRTNGITAPSGLAQRELLRDVYAKHGVDPATVTMMEAHGTGTKLGDPIEFEALTAAFGEHTSQTAFCALGSVKTNIGHLATAAGIAGIVKVVLAMRHRQIPPSLHFSQPNEHVALDGSPFFVNTELRPWTAPVPRAGVSSFGFGGANAHVVLEAAPPPSPREDIAGAVLLPVSANDEERLAVHLEGLRQWAAHPPTAPLLRDVAFTLQQRRAHFPARAILVVSQVADIATAPALRLADLDAVPPALRATAAAYLQGDPIAASDLVEGRTVSLPGQVFLRRRYWYKPAAVPAPVATPHDPVALFTPVWHERPAAPAPPPTRVATLESAAHLAQLPLRDLDCLVVAPESSPTAWEAIARALCEAGPAAPKRVVTAYLATGPATQEMAAALGPALSPLLPQTQFTVLRLADPASLAAAVTRELATRPAARTEEVEYRDGARRSRLLAPVSAGSTPGLRHGATYLITGGAGQLGERLAARLLHKFAARVVITGRSPQAPEWAARLGVTYLAADVTDPRALANVGPIHGVFHLAGIVSGKELPTKSSAEFAAVLRPKVDGLAALDQATSAEPLELFVAFSSAAALLGDFGQCDYSMANRFLDAFCARRESARAAGFRHGRTVSINWPLWREGGMHFAAETETSYLETSGLRYLETVEGLDALEQILAAGVPQALPLVGDATRYRRWLPLAEEPVAKPAPSARLSGDVETILRQLVALVAKTDAASLPAAGTFGAIGLDSIMLAELAQVVSQHFGLEVLPTAFFEHNSIAALAAWISAQKPTAAELNIAEPNIAELNIAEPSVDTGTIAIIGLSGAFPGAPNLEAFWRLQIESQDAITRVPTERWPVTGDAPAWGGFLAAVDSFDPAHFGLDEAEAAYLDPQHRLFLEHCWLALENAGYDPASATPKDIGVFAGVQFADYEALLLRHGLRTAERTAANAHSRLARRVSDLLHLTGPSEAVNTACSSSLVAIHEATRALRLGRCEAALVGGVSLMLTPDTMAGAHELGVLSATGHCHTLDAAADGFVKGEGVGVVLLKPLAAAQRDGDFIHAVIRGTSVNHGGAANSLTAPNPEAQAALLAEACTDAAVEPDSITYLEMHGTGTKLGDPVEVQGILRAWPHRKGRCGLGSIKANIGHLEPAAGIAGLLRVVQAMQHQTLPGMPNFREQNPFLRLEGTPLYPVGVTQPWDPAPGEPRRAGVSSFGFGGANAHVVLEEAPPPPPATMAEGPWLIQLSNRDNALLTQDVHNLLAYADGREGAAGLADVAFTTGSGRAALPVQMAVAAASWPELRDRLRQWLNGAAAAPVFLAPLATGRRVPLPPRAQAKRRCWWDAPRPQVVPVIQEPGIATLTLPSADADSVAHLTAALAVAAEQPDVRGVVLHLAPAVWQSPANEAHRLVDPVRQSKVPILVAVGTDAQGPALHVALSADMTLLAEECRYRLSPPAPSLAALLDERLGAALAAEMILSGRAYPGAELRSRGARIVICPAPQLEQELRNRARSLAQRLRGSVLLLKNGPLTAEPPTATPIATTLNEVLRDIVHITPPSPDVPFADMGIDSVSGVEVIRELNRRLHLQLEAAMLYDHPTPRALAEAIAPRHRAAGASA
jgi:acyl transferase domain-containing protein/acyl carrier protein/SAM-dependent methyltransferase/NAD(P)-dependent dehydrogenase (short-subunit alcohol dehydrogenase family)